MCCKPLNDCTLELLFRPIISFIIDTLPLCRHCFLSRLSSGTFTLPDPEEPQLMDCWVYSVSKSHEHFTTLPVQFLRLFEDLTGLISCRNPVHFFFLPSRLILSLTFCCLSFTLFFPLLFYPCSIFVSSSSRGPIYLVLCPNWRQNTSPVLLFFFPVLSLPSLLFPSLSFPFLFYLSCCFPFLFSFPQPPFSSPLSLLACLRFLFFSFYFQPFPIILFYSICCPFLLFLPFFFLSFLLPSIFLSFSHSFLFIPCFPFSLISIFCFLFLPSCFTYLFHQSNVKQKCSVK